MRGEDAGREAEVGHAKGSPVHDSVKSGDAGREAQAGLLCGERGPLHD